MFLVTMTMIVTLEYLYSTSSTFPSFIVRKYVKDECNIDSDAVGEDYEDFEKRDGSFIDNESDRQGNDYKPTAPVPDAVANAAGILNNKRKGPQFVDRILEEEKEKFKHSETEVRHIGFLKVHKAASSTLQNIFFRFGYQRNLTFVFTTDVNYFSRKKEEHYPVIPPRYRTGYDILCNHGIFNYTSYTEFLPEDSVYIAIVRDPLELFVSAVNYYTKTEMYLPYLRAVPGNKVQNLIRNTSKYDPELFSYTRNVMARDLGFPNTEDDKKLGTFLAAIQRKLKLVLIVEHFDESLILMKRYLHWNLQDVLYIPNNVFGKGYTVDDLTSSDMDKFAKRNRLDFAVYNYFYDIFWKRVLEEGSNFHHEVLYYRSVLKRVSTFCKHISKSGNSTKSTKGKTARSTSSATPIAEEVGFLVITQSAWNERFIVTVEDCKNLLMKELDFIKLLRKVQGSEILPSKVFSGEKAQLTKYQKDMLLKDKVPVQNFTGISPNSKKYFRGWRLPILRGKFRKEYKHGLKKKQAYA